LNYKIWTISITEIKLTVLFLLIVIQVLNQQSRAISALSVGSSSDTAATSASTSSNSHDTDSGPFALKRFKLLSQKIQATIDTVAVTSSSMNATDSVHIQLRKYIEQIHTTAVHEEYEDALKFWACHQTTYKLLAPIAEDLIAAPASQAYVERIFSLCGLLTAGRRNRMTKNLEMRVFLKLNKKLLA
jgi:hypothetical protein